MWKMNNNAVQIKVVLKNSKPPIWRRILVNSSITFEELHYTIQIAMGWGIFHLYEFAVDDYRIGVVNDEMEDYGFGSSDIIDSADITLKEVLAKDYKKIIYEYDFGDGWIHNLEIEKILPLDEKSYYPVCLTGSRNCPPEDCGGIPGFYNLLEIIGNKWHPEYEEMMDWLGGSYDPSEFDLEETNLFLTEIKEIMDEDEYEEEDEDEEDEI